MEMADRIRYVAEDILSVVPDEIYLRIQYFCRMGRGLHLRNPKKLTEKLQWMKLYDRNPLYTTLADKYEVRQYVKEKVGEEYLVPLLGVWDSADEIDFDALPNEFVLKCTHDSGSIVVCRDKSSLDIPSVRKLIAQSMRHNYYWHAREWPYKNIKPRVIAEQYITARHCGFYCFGGVEKVILITDYHVDSASKEIMAEDYFDADFQPLSVSDGAPKKAASLPARPQRLETMQQMVRALSTGLPYVRVDLYDAGERLYFGEITFYNHAGYCRYQPTEWDEKLGSFLELPGERIKG